METKNYSKIDVNLDEFTGNIVTILPDLAEMNNYQTKSAVRRYLVDMGKTILPQLNKLLQSKNPRLRKEASKIIDLIGNKESIPTFISLLNDDESSVRWIAAEGLSHIGRDSIVPLLYAVIEHGNDNYLKLGARHVFLNLFSDEEKEEFRSLLISLKSNSYLSITAPFEAFRALISFKHLSFEAPKLVIAV
jgi:FOG: HEAT repeat